MDSCPDGVPTPRISEDSLSVDEGADAAVVHFACHGAVADTPLFLGAGASKSLTTVSLPQGLIEVLNASRREPGPALLVLDACHSGTTSDSEPRSLVPLLYEYLKASPERSLQSASRLATLRVRSGMVLGRAQRRHKRAHLLLEQLREFDPQVRSVAETAWAHGCTGIKEALASSNESAPEQQDLRRWLADALKLAEEFIRIHRKAELILFGHLRLVLEMRAACRFELAASHVRQPRKPSVRPLAASLTAHAPPPSVVEGPRYGVAAA
jgi:hypothetical protein